MAANDRIAHPAGAVGVIVRSPVDRKRSGPEKGRLHSADLEFHPREYDRLTAELELAYSVSKLPDMPSARGELNDLLVRLRLNSA